MTVAEFRSAMLRAQTMGQVSPDEEPYWRGFRHGLRRAFHGADFDPERHELLMGGSYTGDPMRDAVTRGYRDGLAVRWPAIE